VDWFRTVGLCTFIVGIWFIVGTSQQAFADTIFIDDFSVDPASNGWSETSSQFKVQGFPITATGQIVPAIVQGTEARFEKTGLVSGIKLNIDRTIDTTGFSNIAFNVSAFQDSMGAYDAFFTDPEPHNALRVEVDYGSGFVLVFTDMQKWNGVEDTVGENAGSSIGGQLTNTATGLIPLSALADNNPNFKIRISWTTATLPNDFLLDNFELNGVPFQQNNPPIAEDDFGLTNLGESATIIVLENDSDEDGDELTVVSVTLPSMGIVVMNEDNSVTYTPNENFLGLDTFTYTISDGTDTATATVSVKEKDAFDLLEELFDLVDNLEPSEIKNPGSLVSQAANLLKMLEGADKATHDEFIDRFHDFKDLVKERVAKGKQETLESVLLENELDKLELKLKIESSKILENNSKNKKIQTAIDLSIQKKDLIKTKNRLAVAQLLPNSLEKDKLVEQLELEKIELLKNVIILDAKHNDKKITTDFLKKLDEKITEEKEGKKSQNDKNQDNKSNNSKKSDKKSDNKNKGNSSKSKSKNK